MDFPVQWAAWDVGRTQENLVNHEPLGFSFNDALAHDLQAFLLLSQHPVWFVVLVNT